MYMYIIYIYVDNNYCQPTNTEEWESGVDMITMTQWRPNSHLILQIFLVCPWIWLQFQTTRTVNWISNAPYKPPNNSISYIESDRETGIGSPRQHNMPCIIIVANGIVVTNDGSIHMWLACTDIGYHARHGVRLVRSNPQIEPRIEPTLQLVCILLI